MNNQSFIGAKTYIFEPEGSVPEKLQRLVGEPCLFVKTDSPRWAKYAGKQSRSALLCFRTPYGPVLVIRYRHPCGIEFDLVETDLDSRPACVADDIPDAVAIRGVHSVTLSLRDVAESISFMTEALDFRHVGNAGPYYRFEINTGGPGTVVEFHHEPERHQGSSIYGEGTVHHVAFAVDNMDQQMILKERFFAMGYIDTSESVNRNYFRSMYFKLPGG